ncbi:MAG TPA: hypothetical protein VEO95_01305, partial [Chthoniobacteraceae bacterium]|nr:hypothetical protein [Chthoniobacteraceae bacterium]
MLNTSAGRTFTTMPKSTRQTSPRLGFIFLRIEHHRHAPACLDGDQLDFVQLPAIDCFTNQRVAELGAILGSELVKSFQKFGAGDAHFFHLYSTAPATQALGTSNRLAQISAVHADVGPGHE